MLQDDKEANRRKTCRIWVAKCSCANASVRREKAQTIGTSFLTLADFANYRKRTEREKSGRCGSANMMIERMVSLLT